MMQGSPRVLDNPPALRAAVPPWNSLYSLYSS